MPASKVRSPVRVTGAGPSWTCLLRRKSALAPVAVRAHTPASLATTGSEAATLVVATTREPDTTTDGWVPENDATAFAWATVTSDTVIAVTITEATRRVDRGMRMPRDRAQLLCSC